MLGQWETSLQPVNRQTLANNLLQFVSDFNLDGIDVDIEGVIFTNRERCNARVESID